MMALLKQSGGLKLGAQAFFQHQAAGGILLIVAAALALILDNSPLAWAYDALLQNRLIIKIGALELNKPLLLWINDGLMAIFFFLVGLEIKREVMEGRLSNFRQAGLPLAGAAGGVIVPALIYTAFNHTDPISMRGWAIPSATDIAFALGILALLGSRVPAALKVFLLALAIVDDVAAIVIIALFYTSEVATFALVVAVAGLIALAVMNLANVTRLSPYIVVGLIVWICVLKSGVHATLAGVIVALFVPLNAKNDLGLSPLKETEHALAPWVAFGIMPLFAFANAGVALYGLAMDALFASIPLGIAAGLFFGNQLGIMSFTWLAVKVGLARLPDGVTWFQIYGASILAGVGFTMSLFIGTLAFDDPEHATAVRIGVLAGSMMSAIAGYFMLRIALPNAEQHKADPPASSSALGAS